MVHANPVYSSVAMTDFVIITENPLFGLDEGDRTGSTQYIWLDYVDSETSFVILPQYTTTVNL